MRFLLALLFGSALVPLHAACDAPPAATEIALPSAPFDLALTADGCHAFVSLMNPGGIAVVARNGSAARLLRVAPTPSSAAGSALTHDGKLLIAAAIDRVLVLDTACLIAGCAQPILGTIPTGKDAGSIHLNVSPDDRWLFVSEERAAAITVIDLARARRSGFGASAIVGRIPTGRAPIAVEFSADGRWLFATSQVALDDWGWPAACTREGEKGATELTRPEGALLVIDVARATVEPASAVLHRVPAGCSAVRLALSPARDRVYVTARNSDAVVAFDAARLVSDPTRARLGKAAVGVAPVPLAVVDGGRVMVVGNSNRFGAATAPSTLTLLDAARISGNAPAIIGTLPAGAFPRALRLSPDGGTLYLANYGSKSLQVMPAPAAP